jgi:sugar O-acyltransferase (sialic acid O-acetyltransferase NeuD family)
MEKKIVILGASGGCFDIVNLINDINKQNKKKKYKIYGFLDDRINKKAVHGIKILGKFNKAKNYKKKFYFVTAIGNSKNFRSIKSTIEKLKINKKKFVTLIHPKATISKFSSIGYGCLIFQNVTISTNVIINDFIQIMPNAVINHDSLIGSYCKINTGCNISSEVTIKDYCYLGAGSIVKEKTTINCGNLIGMGSVVLKSIHKKNRLSYGYPAKIIVD